MKRFTSILTVLCIMLSLSIPASAAGSAKMSDWAAKEIGRAERLNLLTGDLGADYTKSVTRLQFAGLAVRFAEAATGTSIDKGRSTFSDTTAEAALKARAAGIVNGTGDGTTFSPTRLITREEIAAMVYRAVQYVDKSALKSADTLATFTDAKTLSDWATEPMRCVVASGIMKGASDTLLSPKGSASIEQAILLIYRSYAAVTTNQAAPAAQNYAKDQISVQGKLQQEYAGSGPAVSFTASRVNFLQLAEVYSDVPGHPGTYLLFTVSYSLKANDPNAVILVGGLDIDADGWVTDGMSDTLVILSSANGLDLVGGYQTEFTADGNAQVFRSDFENWLGSKAQSRNPV